MSADKKSDWKMDGKPALILMHMQQGLVGKGTFIPGWFDAAKKGILESGMIPRIQDLLKAFREKNLPVIFVSALPNPIGTVPAYGWLYRKIEDAKIDTPLLDSPHIQQGLQVIPEMNRRPDEPLLYNWLLGAFTNSGLDLVLKLKGVRTIVLAGFAQHSVVYTTAVQAGDLWYSTIMPRDASVVFIPRDKPGATPELDKKVSEVVLDVMAPTISLVTTTADVIAHL
jgi:nicotinamidase-related amidase